MHCGNQAARSKENRMKKVFVAAVAFLSFVSSANAAPIDQAIAKLYAAPNSVQNAVYLDYCKHWDERAEEKTARAQLSKRHAVTYDAIERAVSVAFKATNQTDSELDAQRETFCNAAENR
jgi:hypothetical protein